MNTATTSVGEFLRRATESLDWFMRTNLVAFADSIDLTSEMDIAGTVALMDYRHMEQMIQTIRHLMYCNYGGWNIAIELDQNDKSTGRFAFVPACSVGFAGL